MEEEKLNTGQGEQITMDEAVTPAEPGPDKDAPAAPEQDGPAQPETGDVALNNEAEAAAPGEGAKEPEAPTPRHGGKSAGGHHPGGGHPPGK